MSLDQIGLYSKSNSSAVESNPDVSSSFFGRTIKAIASVVKVTATSLMTLGLFSIPVSAATETYRRFRPYIARFVHPGEQAAINGTMSCDIQSVIESRKFCESNAASVLDNLKRTQPELLKDPSVPLGYPLPHASGRVFRYLINPIVHANYKKGLQFVEETFFGPKCPLEGSPDEIVTYIKDLHRKLVAGLPDEHAVTPGEFRKNPRYYGSEYKFPQYLERAKTDLSPRESVVFTNCLKKLQDKGGLISIDTKEEADVWQKVGLTAASEYTTIPRQMRGFAIRMLELIEERMDPIDLAAYVHTEIARITPFVVANGELARILVNAILARYGTFLPLVFQSKKAYITAIDQAVAKLDYRIFARYLRNDVLPWVAKMQHKLRAEYSHSTTFASDAALFMKPGYLFIPRGTVICSMSVTDNTCKQVPKERLETYKNALKATEERVLNNTLAFTDVGMILNDINFFYEKLSLEPAVYRTVPKEERAPPETITQEMVAFSLSLQLRLEKESNFVETAAWAHAELIRISPYIKHNKAVARLLLITLLARYTPYNRLIFSDSQEYHAITNQTLSGDLSPFIAYIHKNH